MQRNEEPPRFRHKTSNSISSISSSLSLSKPPSLRRSASTDNVTPISTKAVVSPPESRRRPSAASSHTRSRSNSNGILREGIGNLNRWSQSTSSTDTRSKSNSFSQHFASPSTPSPGRRLHKHQRIPSTDRNPSGSSIQTIVSDTTPQLPPIVTLPSFQQAVDSSPISRPPLVSAKSETGPVGPEFSFSQRNQTRLRSASTSDTGELSPRAPDTPTRRQRRPEKGHTRQRSQASSAGTVSSERSKDRSSRGPSQKAMLSKALQKANTAVLLDNAQNFEGAIQAYSEACTLLQQVMQRSSGEDDRRKLEAIRATYTSRIAELQKIAPPPVEDGKALPARPQSNESQQEFYGSLTGGESQSYFPGRSSSAQPSTSRPRESLMPSPFETGYSRTRNNSADLYGERRSYSKSPMRDRVVETSLNLAPPMDRNYMPPPLSPRRPISPSPRDFANSNYVPNSGSLPTPRDSGSSAQGHARNASNESMSWLDTIDESGGSTASSVHSRSSSFGVRRKHIRAASTATEAEFDTALDAAIEAAYDEGFEPVPEDRPLTAYDDNDDDVITNVRRKIALAKERVRQTERDHELAFAREREKSRQILANNEIHDSFGDYEGNDSEEEERILDEMTSGYIMDDFEFGLQSKSALPRESDSSGFSGRTWNSSIGSAPTTAGTSLTTVTESSIPPHLPTNKSRTPPLMYPPPAQALPPPPNPNQAPSLVPPQAFSSAANQSVRSRRLSGQNAKQLKIETTPSQPPSAPPPGPPQATLPPVPKTAGTVPQVRDSSTGRPPLPKSATVRKSSSPFPTASETVLPPVPGLANNQSLDGENSQFPRSGSPARSLSRPGLRKNFSSNSLKNLKPRNLSVSGIDDGMEISPNTPGSQGFSGSRENGRIPTMPALPTPIANSFREKLNGQASGGLYLFDSDIHSPESPGSPNSLAASAPIPLEPCPADHLLRPFWLMRALYQTIAHPRGGYLSTKLFVPRDVWRVKGVKIKGVEDKISNCDYLTAALLSLAKVDTFDADAVLEEMQNFEAVLEQVQTNLSKKLGNEVGVNGSTGLFKDASLNGDLDGNTLGPKSAGPSKSSFSWSMKRLRSKNSNATLTTGYSGKSTPSDAGREPLTLSTLPMTSMPNVRFAKRDVSQIQLVGPHANYMGALARLFDAAQVIDQIARQVEDPGLKHLNSTYVGLELCTRHAAEFFGFYICRFVLTDISLLLDKFIKRGSEWVVQ